MKLLETAGFVYSQRVHVMHVLCHDKNRNGDGLYPPRCAELTGDIYTCGFSWEETDPVAFEIPPQGLRRGQIEAFNDNMAGLSEGLLARVVANTAQIATVAGSHLSAACRAVYYELPSSDARVSDDGKLSARKISAHDSKFGAAITEGLHYKIIRYQVESDVLMISLMQTDRQTDRHLPCAGEVNALRRHLISFDLIWSDSI